MRSVLRAWWKEERRSPPPRATLLRRVGLCLLVLTPLLALQLQRRTEGIARERQGQRDDTLAIMESALAVAERASFDWGHWDAAYAFMQGRNPEFVAHDLSTGAIFDDGTVMVMLRPDRSIALIHHSPAFQLPSTGALVRCAQDNVQKLTSLNSTIRLACVSQTGSLYLGAATPLSNSDGTMPKAGTQVILSPLLKPEYSARIRHRLSTLQRELVFVSGSGNTSSEQVELIQPQIHANGGRLLGIQRPNLLPILGQSLLSDLPLVLAVPGLVLLLRVLTLLERRRQRIRRLQVDRRANRQIRETCRALDQLFDAALPDRGGATSSRILGRLSQAALPGSETSVGSAGLERVSQRFQHFLQTASELALFDALTQLPNRRYFLEQLADTARHHRTHHQWFALLFIDVDKFKIINDTYGHAVGDGVLVSVCQRLKRVMRASDFLARYGGDELVVILDLADVALATPSDLSEIARNRARAMVDSLQEPLQIGELSIAVSLSIGITLVDPDEGDMSAIMQRSDQAMYQAKRSRNSRIVGPDDMVLLPQLSSYQLFTDLMQAIRNHQLQVFFQAICEDGGRPRGVEALARWRHPERGWVEPQVFLEMAEQQRQMLDLGRELIRLSLDGFQQLARKHPALVLYLNLAPSQLLDPGLAGHLLEQLRLRDLVPSQLVLELTEHSILEPNACVQQNLDQLRQAGMRLALDDFGTGYSSLVLLKTLHPDVVKIDKAFTQAVHPDSEAVHIIGLIAELAPRLGLELIGEGIEDQATLEQLQSLGVGLFQGFALGQPAALIDWLASAKPVPDTSQPTSNRSIV